MSREPTDHMTARWDVFEAALAKVLADLPEDRILVVCTGEDAVLPDAYVQFSRQEAGIYAETVSNVYRHRKARLSADQNLNLELLGWEQPGEGGNWWRGFEEELGTDGAAELAVRTLRDVHGQSDVAGLAVTPPEAALDLDVVPYLDSFDDDEEQLTGDERIAALAIARGDYLGRDPDGVHTMEIDGQRIRLLVDELGPLHTTHVAARLTDASQVSEQLVEVLGEIAARAGSYGLEFTGDEAEELWLTSIWKGSADEPLGDGWIAYAEESVEAARWARAIIAVFS